LSGEINGSEGDLVLTSPKGNLQVINPTLVGARDGETEAGLLSVPPEYDLWQLEQIKHVVKVFH
jgi:hypothetical protein